MALRQIALMFAGLHVLICKTWAKVEVNMEDRMKVSLNSHAEIPCIYISAEPAMTIVWSTKLPSRDQASRRIYYYDVPNEIIDEGTDYTGRISVRHTHDKSIGQGSIILTIEKVRLSDEREFICTVGNVSTEHGEGHTQLQIFNSPSLPVIVVTHSGISVSAKGPSKIADCKVDNGYPRPNITWYKDRFPLQNSDGVVKIMDSVIKNPSGLFTVESELFIKVVRDDEDAQFYCEVNYFVPEGVKMTESIPINITVYYPTTEVTLSANLDNLLLKEGDTVEIRCKGNGNPQPLFTFKHKEEVLRSENDLLILENLKRSDSGTYECQTFDLYTSQEAHGSISIKVHYLDPVVVTPEEMVLDQGGDLTLTCNALSSLPVFTAWYKDGMWVWDRHVLTLHNASYDTAGMYVCELTVSVIPELQKQKSVQIHVRGKPNIKGIAVGLVNTVDRSVNLTCYAQGYPIPNMSWDLSDQHTGQSVPILNVEDHETTSGVVSMITVNATSELIANCNASNEFGTTSVSRNIEAFARGTTTTTNAPSTKGGSGVVIAVVIICLLLLAILGGVLYFLYKKGRLPCGRSGKQDFTKEKASKDDIIMEMKSGKSEEAVLLQGVNGDQKTPTEQCDED
ncbi:cell surface glycoprotein MUC18-like isoform X2 [Myxocyprinus asiaticus]|uniref:cell surface glycoprotein MUC18-like isoform X2 n=1 Tax=Myxocyprinus asiaticus TaxID=70543 RepID=UPI0022213030|nr:cell surface glycoprotein MUC18-like isoform X2 [Myxocyprinus asiaticus]